MNADDRVVITGLGMVTPAGVGAMESWKAIREGRVATSDAAEIHGGTMLCDRVAAVREFDIRRWSDSVQLTKLDPMIHYAVAAAYEAFGDAALQELDPTRIGCVMGNCLGGVSAYESALPNLVRYGPRRVSPYLSISMYYAGSAGEISIELGIKGPMTAVATGETAGADALALASEWLRDGEADVLLAGGTESALTPHGLAVYERLGLLALPSAGRGSRFRPYDRRAGGFARGEGAAILALERLGAARARGARIHAELAGAAEGSFHDRPGDPARAIAETLERALDDAGLAVADVDLIVGNGDAVPAHDLAEVEAFRRVFGMRSVDICVTAVKPAVGHGIAASAAIEAATAVLAITEGTIPPIAGLSRPIAADLDFVCGSSRSVEVRAALAISLGVQDRIRAVALRACAPSRSS